MFGEIASKVFETTVSAVEKGEAEIPEKIDQGIEKESYKDIMPENAEIANEADSFWDDVFSDKETNEGMDNKDTENEAVDSNEDNLETALDDYFQDLKDRSECPDTIEDRPFEVDDLEKQSPEKTAEKRAEFDDMKADLKKQWEDKYNRPWPKYDHDVYSANGKLIRKAGSDYDAHHIQPLSMGGKNEVSNITPLNAEDHYDKQGVHAPDSPYSRIEKILGGNE